MGRCDESGVQFGVPCNQPSSQIKPIEASWKQQRSSWSGALCVCVGEKSVLSPGALLQYSVDVLSDSGETSAWHCFCDPVFDYDRET